MQEALVLTRGSCGRVGIGGGTHHQVASAGEAEPSFCRMLIELEPCISYEWIHFYLFLFFK